MVAMVMVVEVWEVEMVVVVVGVMENKEVGELVEEE
jgi:hypothetical protein